MKTAKKWLLNLRMFSRAKNNKTPLPNIRPGEYKIIEKIGSGATSDVYHVVKLNTKKHVVLKVFKPQPYYTGDEFKAEMFKKEANFLKSCKHINIINLYEYQLDEKPYFMVLDFIKGMSMLEIMNNRRKIFTLSETLKYFIPVCYALDYLHGRGYIYCDFKPRNIMVNKKGRCVLIDFGTVRESSSEQQEEIVTGTPAHMAPELWKNSGISPATDIYALGIWLYQMLTGRHPLTGSNEISKIRNFSSLHLNQQPTPASQIQSKVDPIIELVLNKCLAKEMKDRYQNIISVINDLNFASQKRAKS